MLRIDKRPTRGWAVLRLSPPAGDADWRQYAEAIEGMNREVSTLHRPVLLQILDRGVEPPTALMRRELAALRARVRPDALNVVAVGSTLTRYGQIALDWLQRPAYESHTTSSLDEALAILKARMDDVTELEAAARRLARAR